jgi:hypothetical protein
MGGKMVLTRRRKDQGRENWLRERRERIERRESDARNGQVNRRGTRESAKKEKVKPSKKWVYFEETKV